MEVPVRGHRRITVDSRIDKIAIADARSRRTARAEPLEFEVELTELNRISDGLKVKYTLKFGRTISGGLCSVSGEAALHFTSFNPEALLDSVGGDITNQIATEIFRKNYETIYLLHRSLGLEPPSPWITHDVSFSPAGEVGLVSAD